MEFKNLDLTAHADRGAVLQVRHPVLIDDAGMPQILEGVTITVLGKDSTVRKRRYAEFKQKVAADPKSIKAETIADEAFEVTVLSVVAWTGFEENGESFDCTPDNVRRFLKKYDWLVAQIDRFVDDRKNFFFTSKES